MSAAIPQPIRPKLQALRAEFARRTVERAPAAWSRLHLDTRAVLLMLAGVDAGQDHDLESLALRDWREWGPVERASIAQAAEALRWQLNGARDLAGV
jgi:hypothetical protein